MSRFGRKSLILLVIGAAALIGAAVTVAGDPDVHVERKGSVRVVVVDDEGNRHEESFEFDGEPRAFLGVMLDEHRRDGVRVRDVVSDSGAERAGIRAGDVIVGLDGASIDSYGDLTRELQRLAPGDRVDVEVLRDGTRQTLEVELGEGGNWIGALHGFDAEAFEQRMNELNERLEGMDLDFDFDTDAFEEQMEQLHERLQGLDFDFNFDYGPGHRHFFMGSARPRLGVELSEVTPELREHLGSRGDEGVLVGRVLEQTPAEIAGVQVGDLIVAADSESIGSVRDLRRALRDRAGQTFNLEVIRDGRPTTLSVSLPEEDDDLPRESIRRRFEPRRHPARPADRT